MINASKYDKTGIGIAAGFIIPFIIAICVYLISSGGSSLVAYISRIVQADILSHLVSLFVFPNIFVFLIFNRLDMLRATKGVLGITIFWALLVFVIKFLL